MRSLLRSGGDHHKFGLADDDDGRAAKLAALKEAGQVLTAGMATGVVAAPEGEDAITATTATQSVADLKVVASPSGKKNVAAEVMEKIDVTDGCMDAVPVLLRRVCAAHRDRRVLHFVSAVRPRLQSFCI